MTPTVPEYPEQLPPITVDDLIQSLDAMAQDHYVVQADVLEQPRVQPLEIWIPQLGTWVHADGSRFTCDITRGFDRKSFDGQSRELVVAAVKRYDERLAATEQKHVS